MRHSQTQDPTVGALRVRLTIPRQSEQVWRGSKGHWLCNSDHKACCVPYSARPPRAGTCSNHLFRPLFFSPFGPASASIPPASTSIKQGDRGSLCPHSERSSSPGGQQVQAPERKSGAAMTADLWVLGSRRDQGPVACAPGWLVRQTRRVLPRHATEIEHVSQVVRGSIAARQAGQVEAPLDQLEDGGMVGDLVRDIVWFGPWRDQHQWHPEAVTVEVARRVGRT